jgi:hypothetical protein
MIKNTHMQLRVDWEVLRQAKAALGNKDSAFQLWLCMLCFADKKTGEFVSDNKALANWTGLMKNNFSRALGELRKSGLVQDVEKLEPGLYRRYIPQRFLTVQRPQVSPPEDDGDRAFAVYDLLRSLIKDKSMRVAITPKQISQMLGWPDWRIAMVALEDMIRNGYIYRCNCKACVYKILC